MTLIMTIDGGTTNTRVRIIQNEKVLAKAFVSLGVRNTAINGSKKELLEGLRNAINTALSSAHVKREDLQMVVASGMITSNVGIYEIPHVVAPAGIIEITEASQLVKIPELIDMPILFIPGVKNNNYLQGNDQNLESMDIMRGEETETIGILKIKSLKGPLTMILPGSHTKVLKVNEHNQITGCLTTMAGEIFSTLATKTILADSIPKSLISHLEPEEILKGASISRRVGLTRGCFFTRIISQFTSLDGNKKANFLLGVILGQDLIAIKNCTACKLEKDETIVIGGPPNLRNAVYYLLEKEHDIKGKIIVLDDDTVEMSTAIGAREIGLNYIKNCDRTFVKRHEEA